MRPTVNFTNNQSGFGLIEVALIVIVVGVLGATGWYAFSSKAKTDKILSQTNSINQSSNNSITTGGINYSVAVPSSFKQQLQINFNNFKPTCSVVGAYPARFTVLKNVADQFIQVAQDCGNQGGNVIYTLQAGKWIQAAISSGTYACLDVDQYKISKLLAPNCYVTNLDGSQTIRQNNNP